ncbi:glutathione S-transferase family protein [Novosphingobium sp. FKTRR1]|uniref:glutathione S-transferase family protein n=1 Tax=unclassified Novosphingobium TaxID=2644732 RepID=UPI001CF06E74|nr:glutathione S-transferase family protein [Novosphingobium sp. FKTRR1]
MKLYGALISPFVRKVALVATAKGIAFESGRGGPGVTDPEFLAVSPFGKIPAINDDGFILADSTAIALYLEAKVPEPVLLPAEPQARGRVIWFDEVADTIFAVSGLKILFNRVVGPKLMQIGGDEELARQGEAELPRILDYLEGVVPEQGWLVGESLTLADYSIGSMFCTMEYCLPCIDLTLRPRTAAWYARLQTDDAWVQVATREERLRQRIMALA